MSWTLLCPHPCLWVVKKSLKEAWLLSNNIFYFFSCFIHYLENKTHWINTNLESNRFSPYSHRNTWLFLRSSLRTSGRIHVAESTLKQTWATHCNETLKTGMQMLKWSPFTDTERMNWHIDKTFRTSRNTRGEKTHLYTQRINKEKLGPTLLYRYVHQMWCDFFPCYPLLTFNHQPQPW